MSQRQQRFQNKSRLRKKIRINVELIIFVCECECVCCIIIFVVDDDAGSSFYYISISTVLSVFTGFPQCATNFFHSFLFPLPFFVKSKPNSEKKMRTRTNVVCVTIVTFIDFNVVFNNAFVVPFSNRKSYSYKYFCVYSIYMHPCIGIAQKLLSSRAKRKSFYL